MTQPLKLSTITARGQEIYHENEIGASISIPKNSVGKDADLSLGACISGPFCMPDDTKPFSPAYVLTTKEEIECSQEATLRMQHNANIQNEDDCKNLVLFEADPIPTEKGYEFKQNTNAKLESIPKKNQFVFIKLKKFVSKIFRIGKVGETDGEG